MKVSFKMGLKARVALLSSGVWYTAFYQKKADDHAVVTFIRRAYYEEVDNPPNNAVAFKTPQRQYDYRPIDAEAVRRNIKESIIGTRKRVGLEAARNLSKKM